jgi:hypothetical protein
MKNKLEQELDNKFNATCIWYFHDCDSALRTYKNCHDGINTNCFAKITVGELEKREKEYNLNKAIQNGK